MSRILRASLTEMTLPGRIREVREALQMTQPQLAKALGYKRAATVSDWERGKQAPTKADLTKTAELGGLSYADAFGDLEEEPPALSAQALDEWGLARARAVEKLVELLERDRRILELRAEAQVNVSKAALLEAEKAPDFSKLSDTQALLRMQQGLEMKEAERRRRPTPNASGSERESREKPGKSGQQ